MSPGQTGHKPGGVPPKFFMFIGFLLSPTKGVFSSESSSASTGKKRFGVYQKACFQRKGRKTHIHQRAFKVVVGDPFAQYWCIELPFLYRTCTKSSLPFCVAFAPLFPQGNWPFPVPENPPLSVGRPTISTGSLV